MILVKIFIFIYFFHRILIFLYLFVFVKFVIVILFCQIFKISRRYFCFFNQLFIFFVIHMNASIWLSFLLYFVLRLCIVFLYFCIEIYLYFILLCMTLRIALFLNFYFWVFFICNDVLSLIFLASITIFRIKCSHFLCIEASIFSLRHHSTRRCFLLIIYFQVLWINRSVYCRFLTWTLLFRICYQSLSNFYSFYCSTSLLRGHD
jgi:hypothetical protein